MTRDSERAMADVTEDQPRSRASTPTGGPDHPFADGTIEVEVDWDGGWRLRCRRGEDYVPHNLNGWDYQRVDRLLHELRGLVYQVQWRAAQPPEEPQEETSDDE